MKAKYLTSTAAIVAVFASIGLASAQTTPAQSGKAANSPEAQSESPGAPSGNPSSSQQQPVMGKDTAATGSARSTRTPSDTSSATGSSSSSTTGSGMSDNANRARANTGTAGNSSYGSSSNTSSERPARSDRY